MNSRLHVAALLALAVLLVVVLVRCAGGDGPASAPEPVGFEPEAQVEEGPDAGALATSGAAGERSEVEPRAEAPGEADAATRTEPAAPAGTRALHVFVRSETGAPIEGARVGYVRTENGALDANAMIGFDVEEPPASSVRTDVGGRCRLERPDSDTRFAVVAWAAGRYSCSKSDRGFLRELEIVLPAHAGVSGRVVDAETGERIEGATVWAWYGSIDPEHGTATTDESGRFGPLRAPAETMFALTARAEGYLNHYDRPIAPAAVGLDDELEIALRPAKPITVRVVDARSGAPVAGADVIATGWDHLERGTTTDAQGVATLDDILPTNLDPATSADEYDDWLQIEAADHCDVRVHVTGAFVDAEGRIEIPLEPDNVVHLRAVGPPGEPRDGRTVVVECAYMRFGHGRTPRDRSVYDFEEPLHWLAGSYTEGDRVALDADGRATVRNIPPGLVGLEIRTDDDERRLLAEVGSFAGTGETREVVVSLDR